MSSTLFTTLLKTTLLNATRKTTVLATLSILFTLPCMAAGLGTPDTNCNPVTSPPSAGGCTWYNFYATSTGIQAGSSFANFYVAAPAPPWTVTTSAPTILRVLDGGHQGDMFDVYDNGVLLGSTSPTPIDANHACGSNDPSATGTDPAACWSDPLISRGEFPLPAGNHSITLQWTQRVPGSDSFIQWFEIGAGTLTTQSSIGTFPHIAAQAGWLNTFTLINKGAGASAITLSSFGDSGTPLSLPLDFPQGDASPTTATSLARNMNKGASLIVSSGPSGNPVLQGSASLTALGAAMDGFSIFHNSLTGQEAVVPLETRNAGAFIIAFDNTSSKQTGVAVENASSNAANVSIIFRDYNGAQIGTANLSMSGNGHTSFLIGDQYPFTANIRGTAEFVTPAGGRIGVVGIRYTPPGSLTTIPPIANQGISGGTFAHFAAGNGWKTTIVLVNWGTSFGNASLSFTGDDGAPLSLQLQQPQTGASTSGSTFSQGIPGGGILVLEASGNPSTTQQGSAQLTSNGNISGYVIFRSQISNQEAVVPIESRITAQGYLIGFDGTNGMVTGIAVANATTNTVNVPVVIRGYDGTQVGTGSIALGPLGHSSFLITDKFPSAANIRGTIEFQGAGLGVVGIRATPALAFTTLPSLSE